MLHLRAPRGGFLLEGNGGDGGDDAVDAELGRRGMAELVEHPVELGKLVKPQLVVISAIFMSVYSNSCWALRTRVIWM